MRTRPKRNSQKLIPSQLPLLYFSFLLILRTSFVPKPSRWTISMPAPSVPTTKPQRAPLRPPLPDPKKKRKHTLTWRSTRRWALPSDFLWHRDCLKKKIGGCGGRPHAHSHSHKTWFCTALVEDLHKTVNLNYKIVPAIFDSTKRN